MFLPRNLFLLVTAVLLAIGGCGDPELLPAEEAPTAQSELESVETAPEGATYSLEYGGLGIAISDHDGAVVISEVFEGLAGHRLGLLVGDEILAVDGLAVAEMTSWEVVTHVRGEPGTEVSLEVVTAGEAPRLLEIERDHIVAPQTRRQRHWELRRQTEFGGVGLRLQREEGAITVAAVFEGLPAERAGVQVGDRIVSVDGVSTRGSRFIEVIGRIRGTPASVVELELEAGGEVRLTRLEREIIVVPEQSCRIRP